MKKHKQQLITRTDLKKNKKRRKRRKLLLVCLVPILLLLTATGVYAYNIWNKAQQALDNAYQDDGRDRSELREEEVNPIDNHVSVLFIGVDASDKRANEDNALSDALVLATLNRDDHSVKLLSIPRDSYVYIPEVGYEDKINHAHARGGPLATIGAVEGFLDIPVDYWVRLNFHAFVDVVDALGGITVDVPYEFTEQDSSDRQGAIHLYPGIQNIDGEEALALARTRKKDNDIYRGMRQQEIMQAILAKAASFGSISRLDNVIEAVGDNMATNLSFNEIISFLSYAISGNLDVESLTLSGDDLWLNNGTNRVYYYQLDEENLIEIQNTLKAHLGVIDEPIANEYLNTENEETLTHLDY